MKTRTLIAASLILTGVIAFIYQGISYTTTEDAIDIGPLKITTEQKHTIPLPPIVGGLTIVGGVIVLASGRKHV